VTWFKRVFWAGLGLGIGLAVWAFWWEPASVRVSPYSLQLEQWPKQCSGLKVAVLADIHVGSPYHGIEQLRHIVTATNAAKPDLILLAGDYVIQGVLGGEFVTPEDAAIELAKLKAKLGTFAVLGNHDWWLDPVRVSNALEQVGITMLEDKSELMQWRDCRFNLVGVSDFWEGPHDLGLALADIDAQVPSVLLTHNPDLFPLIPKTVTLTIAGHTHGGQVYVPFIGRPIVPSDYGETYAVGFIVELGKQLFVSTGLGTSIIPVRFLVPPEVSLLYLN